MNAAEEWAVSRGIRIARPDPKSEAKWEEWLKRVDAEVIRRTGLGIYDLPDWNWRDAYEDGSSAKRAAASAIRAAKEF